jgi:hypothetical protein
MGKVWTDAELKCLKDCVKKSESVEEIIARFQGYYPRRSSASIRSMVQKMGVKASSLQPKAKAGPDESKIESLKSVAQEEVSVEKQSQISALKDQVNKLKSELQDTRMEVATSQKLMDFMHGLKDATFDVEPDWLQTDGKHSITGIPVLFLSDIHFDEVVDPAQIGGVNKYNHEIAVKRIQHTFQSAVDLCTKYMHEPTYDGIVVALGGDMLSGNIHEELAETNEAPILQSAVDLTELLCQGIKCLADTFGKVFIPCVVGNHGRLHRKPRAKNRVKDNYEWIIYQNLAHRFAEDERITFMIPDGSDAIFKVFNKTFLLTHGDQFRGGSGIAGIFSPLFIGQARKQKRQQAVHQPFDVMMIGHWHQYIHTETLIVNGSIKGLDEYAYQGNFGYERPQQALFIVHPDLGITYRMPILCDGYEGGSGHDDALIKVWDSKGNK